MSDETGPFELEVLAKRMEAQAEEIARLKAAMAALAEFLGHHGVNKVEHVRLVAAIKACVDAAG